MMVNTTNIKLKIDDDTGEVVITTSMETLKVLYNAMISISEDVHNLSFAIELATKHVQVILNNITEMMNDEGEDKDES